MELSKQGSSGNYKQFDMKAVQRQIAAAGNQNSRQSDALGFDFDDHARNTMDSFANKTFFNQSNSFNGFDASKPDLLGQLAE